MLKDKIKQVLYALKIVPLGSYESIRKQLSIAEKSIDWQFNRQFGQYINHIVVPLADKIQNKSFDGRTITKEYTSQFTDFKALTALQRFTLELESLSRVIEQSQILNTQNNFPVLVGFDLLRLQIKTSHNGTCISDVKKSITVYNSERQVDNILRTLEKAGVTHVDMTMRGTNFCVDSSGNLSLIDFDMTIVMGNAINFTLEEKKNSEFLTTKERIFRMLERNKKILLK